MEPPSSNRISVSNHSGKRVGTDLLIQAVQATLSRHNRSDGEVDLLLTDDTSIQALNKQYRDLDEPTDVLSFPAPDFPNAPLGEIAISVPYAERQAAARGLALEHELAYLAIHGTLHLLGLDDLSDEDRARMMAEMAEVGEAVGLPREEEWSSILHGGAA